MPPNRDGHSSSNRRLAAACVALVFVMTGAAYAAVPLYRIFCQLTGFGGTIQRTAAAPAMISDQMVTIRFDANTQRRLNWAFAPTEPTRVVRLGEVHLVHYRTKNLTAKPATAIAAFNVAPAAAAIYFNKMACFCFEEQTLAPGEEVLLPVQFFVDPEMLQDSEASSIKEITLSYSFAEAAGATGTVAGATVHNNDLVTQQTF